MGSVIGNPDADRQDRYIEQDLHSLGPPLRLPNALDHAPAQPINMVSENVSSIVPSKMNRKFNDIVLLIPGRRTFQVEAMMASRK